MNLLKNKKFLVSILIDFSFLAVFYLVLSSVITKIKGYAAILQEMGGELANLESALQGNLEALNQEAFLGTMQLISEVSQKISKLFLVLIIGGFFIYLIFQSIQWSYILNNFKKFKKYLLKFSLISLASYIISLYFLFQILSKVRPVLLSYFSGAFSYILLIRAIFWLLLLFVLGYYTTLCYVFLKNNNIIISLKKTFLFNKLKPVFVYFLSIILIFGILFLIPRLDLNRTVLMFIEIILILGVINYFRYYLVKLLQK